jgi:hypothetical protein
MTTSDTSAIFLASSSAWLLDPRRLAPGLTARRPVDALNDLAAVPSAGDMSNASAGSV